MKSYVQSCLAVLALLVFASQPVHADGLVVVSGSDGDTFHGHSPYATDMRDYLDQGSVKDLLVLGDAAATGAFSAAVGGVGIVTTSTLVAFDLSDYSGLYLLSNSNNGPGCCDADDPRIVGFETEILALVLSGGSFGIQDYNGEAAFDFILGTSGGANNHVYGFLGGLGGTNNYDDETPTAAGAAAGFDAYPALGAWGHQGFQMSFFSGLGFIALETTAAYADPAEVAGLMSMTVPVQAIPEPASLTLLALGGLGMVGYRLRRRR